MLARAILWKGERQLGPDLVVVYIVTLLTYTRTNIHVCTRTYMHARTHTHAHTHTHTPCGMKHTGHLHCTLSVLFNTHWCIYRLQIQMDESRALKETLSSYQSAKAQDIRILTELLKQSRVSFAKAIAEATARTQNRQ